MSKKRKWIGVFGGSFDPPHLGHLLAAVYGLKVYEFDEVWFVPAFRHAFEKKMAPYADRRTMLRELLNGASPRLRICDVEREIRSDGKMLKTLDALRSRYPSFAFSLLVGSDIKSQIRKWHQFSKIQSRYMVFYVPRGGSQGRGLAIPNISSTEIRKHLKNNKPTTGWLPEALRSYAIERRLYSPNGKSITSKAAY